MEQIGKEGVEREKEKKNERRGENLCYGINILSFRALLRDRSKSSNYFVMAG